MTQTNKQRTVAEKVAAETPYQRAAAIWVGRQTGLEPAVIYGVDFDYEPDGYYSELTPYSGYAALRYMYRGRERKLDMSYFKGGAGRFIEECVQILDTLKGEERA